MQRRDFVGVLGAAAFAAGESPGRWSSVVRPKAETWRDHFPALRQSIDGQPLAYLDSAATALRPNQVIDAIAGYSRTENANPGGALHTLARRSAELYEGARRTVAGHIGASDPGEVIFTRGTTDAINLVAASWGGANLRPGDEILIGRAEHASNMVPWQMIAARTGATVRYFGVRDDGHPDLAELDAMLGARTKVVAFSHVSNVLGMINDAAAICARVRAPGRIVVIDGAQSVPHFTVDVRKLGCDFLAFSGHKMLGPMGIGVLWGRRELLDAMPPYQGGSNMAHDVGLDSLHLSEGALKFGAGTPNVSGPVGLAAAIGFLRSVGDAALRAHEEDLVRHFVARVGSIDGVRLLGSTDAREKISVFAFTVRGREPRAVLQALDRRGIAVRAGDLASLPLLERLGTRSAVRASLYLYSSREEIDRLADGLSAL
jgi:cysteine desulfurase/selenocysteine lyase